MTDIKLYPSDAGVWVHCAGYPRIKAEFPRGEKGPEALEGDAAHWLGAEVLKKSSVNPMRVEPVYDYLGSKAPNGVTISNEIIANVKTYLDDVLSEWVRRPTARLFVEEYYPGSIGANGGRLDCVLIDTEALVVILWDYKNGFVGVPAEDNWQLATYAHYVASASGFMNQTKWVYDTRIVQPKDFKGQEVKGWVISEETLNTLGKTLKDAVVKALGPDPQLKAGAHCRYCPARFGCESATMFGINLYLAATEWEKPNLTPGELAVRYRFVTTAIDQLKYIEAGLAEQLRGALNQGGVPGYQLEPVFSREKWVRSHEEVVALGRLFGKDLVKPSLLTPNQARQLGIDPSIINNYSTRESKGFKVSPDDNRISKIFKENPA